MSNDADNDISYTLTEVRYLNQKYSRIFILIFILHYFKYYEISIRFFPSQMRYIEYNSQSNFVIFITYIYLSDFLEINFVLL